MQEIINLLVNNGTAIAVIAYFIYRDNKFMSTLNSTLTQLMEVTNTVKKLLEKEENQKWQQ